MVMLTVFILFCFLLVLEAQKVHTQVTTMEKYSRYGIKWLEDCLVLQWKNNVWKLWLQFHFHLIRCPVHGRWCQTNTLSSTRKGILSLLHTYYFIASQMLGEERKVIHMPRVTPSRPPHTDFPVPSLVQPTHHFPSLWENIRCILPWLVQKWYSALQMFI